MTEGFEERIKRYKAEYDTWRDRFTIGRLKLADVRTCTDPYPAEKLVRDLRMVARDEPAVGVLRQCMP